MAEQSDVRWGLARRFELIEWRAYWLGRINRSDLEERFGVSTVQASVDLRSYQDTVPNNIEYDAKEKAYVPTSTFSPKYLKLSADKYLLQLNSILTGAITTNDSWFGSPPPATVIPMLVRSVEPDILRAILRAIEGRQELDLTYQSLTNTRQRTIAPHSLAFDGHRWHARAWCVDRHQFRDFVLSRILLIGSSRPSDANPMNDMEWNTMAELKVVAHPDLKDEQKSAIERDYGMNNGLLVIKTRVSLTYYLIKRLNLDLEKIDLPPERKQIYLSNFTEVEEIQRSAKEEAQLRISASSNSN